MHRRQFTSFRDQAIELRKLGMSYGEIQDELKTNIPRSTLSLWCAGVAFTQLQLNKIEERVKRGGEIGRATAMAINRRRRSEYFAKLFKNNAHLRVNIYSDIAKAKAILATLYLAEGSKSKQGRLTFGNSNPGIIRLFMDLMRLIYPIDTTKFRCTVQCRADQNIPKLETFWSRISGIPRRQFYAARIDPRSIGKKSMKQDYMAVCRIDYFSADLYNDLFVAGKVIFGEELGP